MQEAALRRIDEQFGGEVLGQIPEFERDITGLEMIERMAEAMFGGAR
jgi:arsenite-transporting ATPase